MHAIPTHDGRTIHWYPHSACAAIDGRLGWCADIQQPPAEASTVSTNESSRAILKRAARSIQQHAANPRTPAGPGLPRAWRRVNRAVPSSPSTRQFFRRMGAHAGRGHVQNHVSRTHSAAATRRHRLWQGPMGEIHDGHALTQHAALVIIPQNNESVHPASAATAAGCDDSGWSGHGRNAGVRYTARHASAGACCRVLQRYPSCAVRTCTGVPAHRRITPRLRGRSTRGHLPAGMLDHTR